MLASNLSKRNKFNKLWLCYFKQKEYDMSKMRQHVWKYRAKKFLNTMIICPNLSIFIPPGGDWGNETELISNATDGLDMKRWYDENSAGVRDDMVSYLIIVASITNENMWKKIVIWRNFRFIWMTDVEISEISPY